MGVFLQKKPEKKKNKRSTKKSSLLKVSKNKKRDSLVRTISSDIETGKVLNLKKNIPLFEFHKEVLFRYFHKFKKPVFAIVSIFLIISAFSYVFRGEASVAKFFPETCLGGWQNPDHASGLPQVEVGSANFSGVNSSVLFGKNAEIFCGGFNGEVLKDTVPTKFNVKFSWLITDSLIPENQDLLNNNSAEEEAVEQVLNEGSEDSESVDSPEEELDLQEENTQPVESTQTSDETQNTTEVDAAKPEETVESAPVEDVPVEAPIENTEVAPSEDSASGGEQSWLNFLVNKAFAQENEENVDVSVIEENTETLNEENAQPDSEQEEVGAVDENLEDTADEVIDEDEALFNDGNFLEAFYTLDGESWESLGTVNPNNWQDLSFEIVNPDFKNWDDLSKLQISLKSLPTLDAAPVVYLDSMYLEVEYEEFTSTEDLSDYQIEHLPRIEINGEDIFDSPKNFFSGENDPTFKLNAVKIDSLTSEKEDPSQKKEINQPAASSNEEQNQEDATPVLEEDVSSSADVVEDVGSNENKNINEENTEPEENTENKESETDPQIEEPVVEESVAPDTVPSDDVTPQPEIQEVIPSPTEETTNDENVVSWFLDFFRINKANAQSTNLNNARVVKSEIRASRGGALKTSPIVENVDGKLQLRIPKPKSDFKPGLYKMDLEILVNGKVLVISQDFEWGVLALNVNRSFFLKDELAYLQVASLDEFGNTLCDSNLELSVLSPSGKTEFFKTSDGTFSTSPTCGENNVTDVPDYFTYTTVDEIGIYVLNLKNLDKGYEVADYFRTEESLPVQVERVGATRINPFKSSYAMTFNIKAYEDFEGVFEEEVPSGFSVSLPKDGGYQNFVLEQDVSGRNKLSWQLNMTSGQKLSLAYEYQAPRISPEFYLLGPVQIQKTSNILENIFGENLPLYSEERSWQIASDAADGTGFLVWDEDGANNQAPHYRIWDGAATPTFGSEQNLQDDESSNDDGNHLELEASPNRHEYIVARQNQLGHLDVQVYTEGAWADGSNAPTNGDFTTSIGTTNDVYKSFDVAYEADTGDALVVYESSSTGDGALKYRVWDGASWSSEGTIDYSGVDEGDDVVRWLECEPDYDTDYIICAWREQTNLGLYGAVWNGSSWVNIAAIDTTDGISTRRDFDVAWEGSGDGMVVYDNSSGLDAATYTRDSGWTDTSGITFSGSAIQWVSIAGAPTHDYIAVMFQDTNSTTSADMNIEMWNGSNWTSISVPTADTDINSNGFGFPGMDVAWESLDDQALFVWRDGSTSETFYRYMIFDISLGQFRTLNDGLYCNVTESQVTSLTNAEGSNGPCSGVGSIASVFSGIKLIPDKYSDQIMVMTEGRTQPIEAEMWLWNGDGTWYQDASQFMEYETDLAPGSTLTATFPVSPYDYAFRASNDTNVAVLGTQTASMNVGSTANYVGGAFAITTSATGVNLDGITITEQGTVDAQELDNVKLFYESDTVSPYNCASVSYGGGESQYGSTVTGGFNGTNGTASFSYSSGTGPSVTATSALCIYVVFDVSSSTSAGQTIEIQIADPSSDVTVDTGSIGPEFGRSISGTTTLASSGISIGGTCKAYDQSTNCGDLGTISVAVNGTLQAQTDTGGGSGGTWNITGVTAPSSGDIVTVFVDGPAGASDRAVAITKYDGSGDITGMQLFKEHLTIGSDDTPATLTSAELGSYDNSVSSGDDDVFFDYRTDWTDNNLTTTGGSVVGLQVDCDSPATSCNTFSTQEELYIATGWTYRPDSGGSDVVATHDIEIVGTLNMDNNDLVINGSFVNSGTFTKTSGQEITFTSTSTGEIVNSGGASFEDVTFNGSGGAWTASTSAFALDGNLVITAGNYIAGGVNNSITGTTSVTGTITFNSTAGSKTFTGDVTINSGGTWTESVSESMTFGGNFTNNDTFTSANGAHTFSGASKSIFGAGTTTMLTVIITGTITNGTSFAVTNSLAGSGTLTQGDVSTLYIGGTVTLTNLDASSQENLIVYNGTSGAQTIKAITYYDLEIDKSAQTATLGGNIQVDNSLTVTSGIIELSTFDLTASHTSITGTFSDNSATGTNIFTGSVTVNNGGTWTTTNDPDFNFRNGLTVNSTSTFTSGSGTYTFDTNAQTIGGTQSYTITNLQNDVTTGAGLTFSGGSPTVTSLNQGTNAILTFSGTVPTITTLTATTSGNTVRYTSTSGAQTVIGTNYVNIEIDKTGQTATLGDDTVLTGNMTITAGTLDADVSNNYSLTVGGNWANSGTFTPRSGLVTLNTGTTATVTGATTFYDLTITHTASKEVDFSTTGAHIITVSHTFTSTGTDYSNMISLYSTSSGSKWHFLPQGTGTTSFTKVRDGGCESGAVTIVSSHFTNLGNNDSCWGASTLTMSLSSNSVSLGTLTSANTVSGSNTISIIANALNGFTLSYNGPTLTNGANTIPVYSSGSSSAGTAGFGINLKANATPSVGSDPVSNYGTCGVNSSYNTADVYNFVASTDTTISNVSAEADCVYTVSYVANAAPTTEAGAYSTTITYIVTGTF